MKRQSTALLIVAALFSSGCAEQSAKTANKKASAAQKAPSRKLKPVMLQLGVDYAAIGAALWRDDFAGISKAARAIADHPHVDADEKKRIIKVIGPEFADFVKGDKRVHSAAARLSEAAKKSAAEQVLKELAELQAGCFDCHVKFRKRLRAKTP